MELSPLAKKVYELLLERGGDYEEAEIKNELHVSKTAIQNALYELEDAGLINLDIEEEV